MYLIKNHYFFSNKIFLASMAPFMDQMSYKERFVNFLMTEGSKLLYIGLTDAETKLFKEFYGDVFPDLRV